MTIEHGTLTAYKIRGCRCGRCREAQRRYNSRRDRLILYGRWKPFVDAEPVRQHVLALRSAGLGTRRIAGLAEVSRNTLRCLLDGHPERKSPPTQRLRPETATALLAVRADLDTLGGAAIVDGAGTHRRLQALVVMGWSQSKLATRIGMSPSNFGTTLRSPRVLVRTARVVRDLYDELWNQAPPENDHRSRIAASRARHYAAKRGWPSPLAWDDDTIDDPAAKPDTGARSSRLEALAENVDELVRQGYTVAQAAERLGVSEHYAAQCRTRAAQRRKAVAS